jgi:hypothetical protein
MFNRRSAFRAGDWTPVLITRKDPPDRLTKDIRRPQTAVQFGPTVALKKTYAWLKFS